MSESINIDMKTIGKLTDLASAIFRLMHDLEEEHKAAAKERLRKTLADVDVFKNSTDHEEWRGE